ncbi:hypothetical protein [Actinoplanes sp. NPDC049118]|uniref:hypothetical protein n=1 Tax=Actinoplanes sp. NPDC049118 TaxID=3155769 RepID=UPI0033C66AD9
MTVEIVLAWLTDFWNLMQGLLAAALTIKEIGKCLQGMSGGKQDVSASVELPHERTGRHAESAAESSWNGDNRGH